MSLRDELVENERAAAASDPRFLFFETVTAHPHRLRGFRHDELL